MILTFKMNRVNFSKSLKFWLFCFFSIAHMSRVILCPKLIPLDQSIIMMNGKNKYIYQNDQIKSAGATFDNFVKE